MGRGADVHLGVVENEVLEVDKLTFEPQSGTGVGEVRPCDPAVTDGAFGEALVEAGERVLGGGERPGNGRPGQRIRDLVAGMQGFDNPNENR